MKEKKGRTNREKEARGINGKKMENRGMGRWMNG